MNPKLHIIAGPNGAGKTAFAGKFLPLFTHSQEFVNADLIAQKLSPSHPERAAFRAGREMLERIDALAAKRADFAIETALAGRSYGSWLRNLKVNGYEIHLYFLWLPDVEMSISRVADRVKHGGHHIPEQVIRRRYAAGIGNLFHIYRPLLDFWALFDNSSESPYLIARETNFNLVVLDAMMFAKCFKMPAAPNRDMLQESAKELDWMPALTALRLAKLDVIEQHCKSGHPLIIWRNGKVCQQPPEEAKREATRALKSDFHD